MRTPCNTYYTGIWELGLAVRALVVVSLASDFFRERTAKSGILAERILRMAHLC